MTVRDLLKNQPPIEKIYVRTNDPIESKNTDGIFFGICAWDGKKLLSLDGDYYSLDEEIYRYEWEDGTELTYWIHSDWEYGEGVKHD